MTKHGGLLDLASEVLAQFKTDHDEYMRLIKQLVAMERSDRFWLVGLPGEAKCQIQRQIRKPKN